MLYFEQKVPFVPNVECPSLVPASVTLLLPLKDGLNNVDGGGTEMSTLVLPDSAGPADEAEEVGDAGAIPRPAMAIREDNPIQTCIINADILHKPSFIFCHTYFSMNNNFTLLLSNMIEKSKNQV